MKKYILNGVPYEVGPEDEQMFIDKGAELVEDDASGNQIDPANSATVGSDSSTETNLSQDNQTNTESNLADTSLVSLRGVNYEVPNGEVEEFLNSNEDAKIVNNIGLNHPTTDQLVEMMMPTSTLDKLNPFTGKEGRLESNLNEWYADNYSQVRFEQARQGEDYIEVLIGDQASGEGTQFPLLNEQGEVDKTLLKDITNHIDVYSNEEVEAGTDADALNFLSNIKEIDYNNTAYDRASFVDQLNEIQGIQSTSESGSSLINSTDTSGLDEEFNIQSVDMTGSVNIGGKDFSYQYLWNNRDKWAEKLNDVKVKNEELVRVEKHGSNEEVDNHIVSSNAKYFGAEDQRIRNINKQLENPNISSEKKTILETEKQAIIDKNNYQDLYNKETGAFIGLNKINFVPDPDDVNYMIRAGKDGKPLDQSNELYQRRLVDASDDTEGIKSKYKGTDLETLKGLRRDAYYKLIVASKLAHDNINEVKEGINPIIGAIGSLIDFNEDSFDNDARQLARIWGEEGTGDIFDIGGGIDRDALTQLPGGSKIAKRYNDALINFKVLNKAVDLNVNPLESNLETQTEAFFNDLSKAFTGTSGLYSEGVSIKDQGDAFEHIMKTADYDIDTIRNVSFRGRGSDRRDWWDTTSKTVTSLTPLLAEIAAFTYFGGGGALKSVDKLIKFATMKSTSPLVGTIGRLVGSTIKTPIEWAVAERVGEKLLADGTGMYDAHTWHVDRETGELKTNLLFPAAMGLSGGMLGMSTNAFSTMMANKIAKSKSVWAPTYMRVASTTAAEVASISTRAVTQGFTASGLLYVSSAVEHIGNKMAKGFSPWEGVDLDSPEGIKLRAEWESFSNMDHFLQVAAAMTFIGGVKAVPKVTDALYRGILKINNNTKATILAQKKLNIKGEQNKNGTWEQSDISNAENLIINNARKEINRINKEVPPAERQALIEAQRAIMKTANFNAKQLLNRNTLIETKAGIRGEQARLKQLKDTYLYTRTLLAGGKSSDEVGRIYEMLPLEYREFKLREGIEPGSKIEQRFDSIYETIRFHGNFATNYGSLKDGQHIKRRNEYIKEQYELAVLGSKINNLQSLIKENPTSSALYKFELDALKVQQQKLTESAITKQKKYLSDFKKKLDKKLAHEKSVIEAQKQYEEYNIIKDSKDGKSGTQNFNELLIKEGGALQEGGMAFVSKDGKRMYIDYNKSLQNLKLGEGIHEIGHMLLHEYLKEIVTTYKGEDYNQTELSKIKKSDKKRYDKIKKDGVENKVISKRGKDMIDNMLEGLTPEERAFIEKEYNKNYKFNFTGEFKAVKEFGETKYEPIFEKKNGKNVEKKWNTIYEEHVTLLAQAIVDGNIKRNINLSQRIGKSFWGPLKIFSPKLYEFDLNQTDSKKAGKDLLKFVESLAVEGLGPNVLRVGATGSFKPGVPNKSVAESRSIYNQIPNLKEGSSRIIQNNTNTTNKLIKIAENKYGKDWRKKLENKEENKKFVEETSELRDKIVEDNINVAHWMSDHPMYGGKGKYKTEGKEIFEESRVKKEEFFQSFRSELVQLSRTYNPSKEVPIGAYLFDIIKFRYPKILDTLKGGKLGEAKRMYDREGKAIEVEDAESFTSKSFESENILEGNIRKRRKRINRNIIESNIAISKLRNEIGMELTASEKNNLLEKVKRDMTISKTPLEGGFNMSLTRSTENTHYDRLAKLLPNTTSMTKYKDVIVESLTVDQLKNLQKFNSMGDVFLKRYTPESKSKFNEVEVEQFMGIRGKTPLNPSGKNLLPQMKNLYDIFSTLPDGVKQSSPEFIAYKKKVKSGVINVWEKKRVDALTMKQFLDAPIINPKTGKKSGKKGTTRESMLKKLSVSLSKDAIPEILKDSKFVQDYINSKNLNIEAKALIEKYVNEIGRSEDIMFSTSIDAVKKSKFEKEKVRVETLMRGSAKIDRMKFIIDEVTKNGVDNVFDVFELSKGKLAIELNKNYENKINVEEAQWIFDNLILKNKVFNTEGGELNKILQSVTKGAERNKGFEQYVIDQFVKLSEMNLKGELKVLQKIQTEKGDLPDVHLELFGEPFPIEVKMSDAQLGSVTSRFDIVNGKSLGVSTEGFENFTPENQRKINKLLEQTAEGWKELKDFYNELSKLDLGKGDFIYGEKTYSEITPEARKYLKDFKFSNDHIPGWAFEMAKNNGYYNRISKSDKTFTETLIQDIYKNKKYPVDYLYWLGKGLLHLKDNPFALNTTKLTGEFIGTWRHGKNSVDSVEGRKHGLVTTALRFIPTTKKVTSENSKLDILSPEGLSSLGKNIRENGGSIRSKTSKDKKDFIKRSKSIDSVRKFIKFGEKRGMSTFDFDETVGVSENFIIAKKDGKTKKIASDKWPFVGDKMIAEGWKMDFSDFDKVTKGKPGPLFQKMKNQIAKYGPDNVFILTARGPGSQPAIHAWLKQNGINIPLKNITGLGQSSGNAKAEWMLEKFSEGYNDMYFVDDALPNVKAVKEVLDQLDIKSKVVQAKIHQKVGKFIVDTSTKEGKQFIEDYKNIPTVRSSEFRKIGNWIVDTTTKEGKQFVKDFDNIPTVSSSDPGRVTKLSKNIDAEFNDMLHRRYGTYGSNPRDRVSSADAKILGQQKNHFDFFVPASAEDFRGLMYKFLGTGKQGNADALFLKEKLFTPYAKAYKTLNETKQRMSIEYKELKKQSSKVNLKQNVLGTNFKADLAIRTYLWEKAGFEIPGMEIKEKQKLLDHMEKNPELIAFAETLSNITRLEKGYVEPTEYWMLENIGSDLKGVTETIHRAEIFKEWIENKNEFFSPENLNKIESVLGTKWRGELEKMLGRMETGRNRLTSSSDANVNAMYDYLNGGVGAIMFWNTRSAALQTISTVNFINWKDNNIFAASKAFANQPQYWKDFAYIFNSPTLKQRRAGLEIDVSASELTNVFEAGKRNPKAVLKYLLAQGFTPTRIADSFAISAGGATFYRNRVNKYIKDGLTKIKAEEKAWEDFQEISEETQQSSRPDLISNQQAGPLGRIVLPFQNTPMQMTRLLKKANSDMVNFRGDFKSNISRILYYGAIQNVIFGTLQSGLAWGMFGSDREEVFDKKSIKVLNGAFDTIMRGTGIYGAAFTTLKNTYMQWRTQRNKDYGRREDWRIAVEMANFSPPIGSKFRKVMNAIKTEEYNKGVSEELGFRIENPNVYAIASAIEGLTNAPLARAINKANNIEEALTGNHEMWQRTAMIMGWSKWSVGVKDEELEVAKATAKEKRKEENKKQAEIKKEQKKKEKEEENKKKGIKTIRCSGKNSSGKRCSLTTETDSKAWKCFHHAAFKDGGDRDNDGKKEYRCIGKTKSGKRCGNKGEYGKARKCYAHK